MDPTSPLTRPSTWQLRFCKKSTFQFDDQHNGMKPQLGNQARSPSISDQLLKALDTKPNEQKDLSRECADVLIGRRNAFASEPEWRLRTQTKDADDGEVIFHTDFGNEDVAAAAKEIIRARLQLEKQAALHQASKGQKGPKQPTHNKCLHRVGSASTKPTPIRILTDNTSVTEYPTMMTRSAKKLPAHSNPTNLDNHEMEDTLTKEAYPIERQLRLQQQQKPGTSTFKKRTRSRILPPHQLPMERRHELLLDARKARRLQAAEESAMHKLLEPSRDKNGEVGRQQRHIEEKIERLALENQYAVAFKERLEHRKAHYRLLSILFNAWYRFVELKQELEAQVVAELNWRVMKCFMATWKRYTHRIGQARVVQRARMKMVREQQMNDQAQQYYRLKRLPLWFYRWMAFVAQRQNHRAAAEAAENRKVQLERLMEKLQRQNALAHFECNKPQIGMEIDIIDDRLSSQEIVSELTGGHSSTQATEDIHQCKQNSQVWTDPEDCQATRSNNSNVACTEPSVQVTPPPQLPNPITRASQHANKVYKAMEQRAAERKLRRGELKRRYEEREQKKQQEQEEQRVAREALIFEKHMEEKARIKERKRATARALKTKHERRDFLLAQCEKARNYNRQRLLFFYALLPWRKHQALIERVMHNADRWHELRTVYLHWERWQEFVQLCQKIRCRRERKQLEVAARFHARIVQRRAFWRLARHHLAIQARSRSISRQHQWRKLEHSWKHWKQCLENKRAYQEKVISDAMFTMQALKLRQICAQWRKVTIEARLQQQIEREKQQLWRKVRGWLDENDCIRVS